MTKEQDVELALLIAMYEAVGGVLNQTIHQELIDQVINAN